MMKTPEQLASHVGRKFGAFMFEIGFTFVPVGKVGYSLCSDCLHSIVFYYFIIENHKNDLSFVSYFV